MEDISANPLVVHPHNTSRSIPERLPAATSDQLSALEPARALAATAGEWVYCCGDRPVLVFLAPDVICDCGHVHRRAPTRADHSGPRRLAFSLPAETMAERALRQPLLDVAGVRLDRGLSQVSLDPSPTQTSRTMGIATSGIPMTPPESLNLIGCFPRQGRAWRSCCSAVPCSSLGCFGLLGVWFGASLIPSPSWMVAARIAFYLCVAGALTVFSTWYAFLLFWIVPYCTWHIVIQYARSFASIVQ